jgi:bacterioferritin
MEGERMQQHKIVSGGERKVLSDVKAIRQRARQQVERGAVTADYGADRSAVIQLLNEALATELVCVLRYKRHYYMAQGWHSESARNEFGEHAEEEYAHAGKIAERIVQLGGEPDFSPDGLANRSHAEYVAGSTLREMVQEDLVAERVAIESYREMINYVGDRDPTTRRLLEEILSAEEEHAEDLATLLFVDDEPARAGGGERAGLEAGGA